MDQKINSILNLIKEKNFQKAKKKCFEIENEYQNNSEFFNIFAIILFQLKEYQEAINGWQKAVSINKKYFHAYNNLANALLSLNNYEDALINLNKAIMLRPDNFELYHKCGDIYIYLEQFENALESYEKATMIKKDYIPSIKNKAKIFIKLQKNKAALTELDKILLYEKENSEIYLQKAFLYQNLGNLDEASKNFKNAYNLKPDSPFLLGNLMHINSLKCDWKNYNFDLKKILKGIEQKKKVTPPYPATTLFDSPKTNFDVSKIWIKDIENKKNQSVLNPKNVNGKIRIAYFSADFRTHAMGHLIVRTLELHDKSKFELYGFYFGPKINPLDKLQKRIIESFDKFIDVSLLSDKKIGELSKKLNINIAIDLMGHTGDLNRFTIFLDKVAPIQISFLGFPGTTASQSIDYLIADKKLIPERFQKYYSEKIIYLPDTYQPNEELHPIKNIFKNKNEIGLPENKFIFCGFNGHHKITPNIFKAWMKILKESDDSILWLLKENEYSEKNLKEETSSLGIDPNRLIFAEKKNMDEHLSRLKFADLFLDTFPYGAHTTCSNALRVNLPILTLIGDSFASRVCASLLKTINMEELITNNIEDYIKLAIKISKNNNYLSSLKEKMSNQVHTSNLFKSDLFTRKLEEGYVSVYKNFLAGKENLNIEL